MLLPDAAALADETFADFRRSHDVPGVAYGLVKDGVLVHASGAGTTSTDGGRTPGPDDVFRIASMTKSVTASAVLLLRDRGALRLDDPLALHLPWAASLRAPAGGPEITVRDLLTMGAGFPTDDPWGDRHEGTPVEAFDALTAAGFSFARAPRTGYEYSNLGYALLGRVVTTASGTDYRRFVETEVLAPLGMASTAYDATDVPAGRLVQGFAPRGDRLVPEPVTGPGAFSPMGGLHSSVADLAVWVAGFERSWHGDVDHPLSRWTLREMQEPRAHVATRLEDGADGASAVTTSYAYGLLVEDDTRLGRVVAHSGGYPGYGSHMRWHPATGWGVVALGNRTYANTARACAALLRSLVAHDLATAAPEPAATLWPRTLEAMDVVERLLASWDDALAAEWLAPNVALDRPLAERRAALERVSATLGSAARSSRRWDTTSPAQVRWWLEGEGGSAVAHVMLSPDREPLVQAFSVELEA